MFSRKQYVAIADCINKTASKYGLEAVTATVKEAVLWDLVHNLEIMFKRENSRFIPSEFWNACYTWSNFEAEVK